MATDHQLSHRSYWSGVVVIIITVLSGLLSSAYIVGVTMNKVETAVVRVDKVEKRMDVVETENRQSANTLDIIAINLKFMMEHQGLKYQDGSR